MFETSLNIIASLKDLPDSDIHLNSSSLSSNWSKDAAILFIPNEKILANNSLPALLLGDTIIILVRSLKVLYISRAFIISSSTSSTADISTIK